MEAQIIRRKCDWCDTVQEFDQNSASFTPAERAQAESWTVLVKVLFALGQVFPVQKHACKQSCAKNLIELSTFELPDHIQARVAEERQRVAVAAAAAKDSGAEA